MTKEQLEFMFQIEMDERSHKIDPHNELDWYSITVGWAIAKGLSPEAAIDFAIHIRYHTDYLG